MATRDPAEPAVEPFNGGVVHLAEGQDEDELVDGTAVVSVINARGAGVGVRDELTARAEAYARGARAGSTWSAYDRQWVRFESWCRDAGERALPAEPLTVVRFLAALAPVWRPAAARRDPLIAVLEAMRWSTRPPSRPTRRADARDAALLLIGLITGIPELLGARRRYRDWVGMRPPPAT